MGWDKEAQKEDQLRLEEFKKEEQERLLQPNKSTFLSNKTSKTLTFTGSMLV